MDNYIIIYINNTPYYIEASRLNDLAFIDNKLVNVSNSSLTLVNSFDYQTSYPRITCSSMSACILRSSSSSAYQVVNSNFEIRDNYKITSIGSHIYYYIFALLFILLGVKLIWKH